MSKYFTENFVNFLEEAVKQAVLFTLNTPEERNESIERIDSFLQEVPNLYEWAVVYDEENNPPEIVEKGSAVVFVYLRFDDEQEETKIVFEIERKQTELEPKHYSDCAVHNEPAYPAGDCDCGGLPNSALKAIYHEFDDRYEIEKKWWLASHYTYPLVNDARDNI